MGKQRNFVVDKGMYCYSELIDLIARGVIFSFDENMEIKEYEGDADVNIEDVFRLSANDCTDIKVVYDKDYGFYHVVAITKAGEQIAVQI